VKKYRVVISNNESGYHSLVYSGRDENEAIECYEQCRTDTLRGYEVCDVILYDGDGKQLARTDASWFQKIHPM